MAHLKKSSIFLKERLLCNIKSEMKKQKVTQKHISKQINVSVTTLVRYFKQETDMPLIVYIEICKLLGLNDFKIETNGVLTVFK